MRAAVPPPRCSREPVFTRTGSPRLSNSQPIRGFRHRLAVGMGQSPYFLLALRSSRLILAQQFVLGLIQGAYCLSPTGMLASMAEEVVKPELTIPRAM